MILTSLSGIKYVWLVSVMRTVKVPAYNNRVRFTGLDVSLEDSLDHELWLAADDPLADDSEWAWNSWFLVPADADILIADVLTFLGPVNIPGEQCQGAFYDSREDQIGASATTAPVGGWTEELILDDLFRKPDGGLQVLAPVFSPMNANLRKVTH